MQYEAGKTYTLAWPPKNHVAAECTNGNIPDAFLRVYMQPYNGATDPTQEEFKQNQVSLKKKNLSFDLLKVSCWEKLRQSA